MKYIIIIYVLQYSDLYTNFSYNEKDDILKYVY